MKLVSTEIKKGKVDRNCCVPSTVCGDESSGPQFEYGTRLTLSGDLLDRLGLSVGDFTIGQEIKVAGSGKVVSVSSSEYEGSKSQSVSIQIEDIGVEPKSIASAEFDSAWEE